LIPSLKCLTFYLSIFFLPKPVELGQVCDSMDSNQVITLTKE
jgi:hypothetical protein